MPPTHAHSSPTQDLEDLHAAHFAADLQPAGLSLSRHVLSELTNTPRAAFSSLTQPPNPSSLQASPRPCRIHQPPFELLLPPSLSSPDTNRPSSPLGPLIHSEPLLVRSRILILPSEPPLKSSDLSPPSSKQGFVFRQSIDNSLTTNPRMSCPQAHRKRESTLPSKPWRLNHAGCSSYGSRRGGL